MCFSYIKYSTLFVRLHSCRDAYRVLVGQPEGRRPLGRPRRRWEDNIKMDLREVGWGDIDGIDLAQDRDRRRVLVNKPSGSIKCGEFLE
jgi:hypothetical protein